MLGFLVVNKSADERCGAGGVLRSLRTLAIEERLEHHQSVVYVYRTGASNNYKHLSSTGHSLVVAGTIMLGRKRAQSALADIAGRLDAGESMAAIYLELRGPFALLVIPPDATELRIFTDRDGLMACFEWASDNSHAIGTSSLAIAAISGSPPDTIGAQEFVHGGACIDGRTLFESVRRLNSAREYRVSGSGPAIPTVLWQMHVESPHLADDSAKIVSTMGDMFADALQTDLLDNSKTFCTDLTAGTDSRTVFSFLLKKNYPLVASTAGPSGDVDVARAQRLSKLAGVAHYWFQTEDTVEFDQASLDRCLELCDGTMNPFGLTKQVPYFEEKAKRYDMLFGGNGGPMFKDHYWLFEFNRVNQMREPNWERIALYSLTEGKVNNRLFVGGIDYIKHVQALFLASSQRIVGTNNQKLDFMYFDLKCKYFHSPQYSFTNRFIDVYHPMCDGRLVEYSVNIQPEIRKRARLQSELIYANSPNLAWVLTDNLVPCVPDTGLRFPLRATRVIRYLRAARRKINDYVLNKKQAKLDRRSLTFIDNLKKTELYECFQAPSKFRLAKSLNLEEVKSLLDAASAGGHSGYVQRLFAVEAIYRKADQLRRASVG